MPGLWGGFLDPIGTAPPWLAEMNGGREPYLVSIYSGVVSCVLALAGVLSPRRRRWGAFWTMALLLGLALGLGDHAPLYPTLRSFLPWLSLFRYPVKLLVFAALALAVLTARGVDEMRNERPADATPRSRGMRTAVGLAAIAAFLALSTATGARLAPVRSAEILQSVAGGLGLTPSPEAARDFLPRLADAAFRLFALSAGSALLLWVGTGDRTQAPAARRLLVAAVAFDLGLANGYLNPTVDRSLTAQPAWVGIARADGVDRVFIDPQSALSPAPRAATLNFRYLPTVSLALTDAAFHADVPYNPAVHGLRDALTVDVTMLRPREYARLLRTFRLASPTARTRFLRGLGVTHFIQVDPPSETARIRAVVPTPFTGNAFRLYTDPPASPRVSVVSAAEVIPSLDDQVARLFADDFDQGRTLLLEKAPPSPVGVIGASRREGALLVSAGPNELVILASVRQSGSFLLVRDSYDPNWSVAVDGKSAPLLRANALYRAVRLAPGDHDVRFTYQPGSLIVGGFVSAATALILMAVCLRRPESAMAG